MVLLPLKKSFGSVVGMQGSLLNPQLLEFLGRRMLGWNEVNIAIFCFIMQMKGLELRALPVIERGRRSGCDGINLDASVNGEQMTTARIKAM